MPIPAHKTGITPAQRRLVQAARRQLGLDDATYRAVLERVAGVRSSGDLDQAGFTVLVLDLERLGFNNTSRGKPFGNRPGFATGAQVALITKLWASYAGSDKGLNAWLERTCHVSSLRFLPFDEASKAIEGLKQMVARGGAQHDGLQRDRNRPGHRAASHAGPGRGR